MKFWSVVVVIDHVIDSAGVKIVKKEGWRGGRWRENFGVDILAEATHPQTEMSAMVRRSPTIKPEVDFSRCVSRVR